jgi:hypothetical protein
MMWRGFVVEHNLLSRALQAIVQTLNLKLNLMTWSRQEAFSHLEIHPSVEGEGDT